MRLIPIYTEERVGYFADTKLVPLSLKTVTNGTFEVKVQTSLLAFDKKIDLLGVSSTPGLLELGLVATTDVIGPVNRISEVHFLHNGIVVGILFSTESGTTFKFDPDKGKFVAAVHFAGYIEDIGEQFEFELSAELNVATSVILASAKVLKGNAIPLGYSVNVQRLNLIEKVEEEREYANQWHKSDSNQLDTSRYVASWDTVAAMHHIAGYFKCLDKLDEHIPMTPNQVVEAINNLIEIEKSRISVDPH